MTPQYIGIIITYYDISVGESAGAASIFGHLTSYGGQHGPGPFQQSLTQSSYGFANAPSVGEHTFQSFLKTARVTSVELYLRSADSLFHCTCVNLARTALVIDGTYVPNQPIRLLLDGNFHTDVHIMQGHNANEVRYPALPSLSARLIRT